MKLQHSSSFLRKSLIRIQQGFQNCTTRDLIEEKTGVKFSREKLLDGEKFSHRCLILVTFPRINLGLR